MKKKITSYEEVTISEELKKKCIEYLKDNPIVIYYDYRDQLSLEQIEKLMGSDEAYFELQDSIWENSIDYICDLEYELLGNMKEEFEELEEFEVSELREEFLDHITTDLNIKQLIRNTPDVRIRVVIHSNYEGCGWADREGDQEYKKSDYVKQVRRILKNKHDERSFQQELDNICSSVNQFIFYEM